MPPSSDPADADVLLESIRAQTRTIRTAIPGIVESYDRATRTATVRPIADIPYRDEDDAIAWTVAPSLSHVPVAFPLLTWDLVAGDDVILVFCERSIAEWKATGGRGHRPNDVGRRHDATDALAIPGLLPPAGPFSVTSVAAGAAVLEHADIRLGSSLATQPVMLATLFETQFVTWLNALATFQAAIVSAIGTGDLVTLAAAAVAFGTAQATFVGAVTTGHGATRVKAL